MSLKIKTQNIRVGGVEMKINFQQHPQGLLESQKTPPRHPPISPHQKLELYLEVLQGSDTFCFLTYLRLCLIFICCSSVKFEQI